MKVIKPERKSLNPIHYLMNFFNEVSNSRNIGWRLFIRDLKGRYRQSLLGILWAFIPPLISAFVWIYLRGQRVVQIDTPNIPYAAFVLVSMMLWFMFSKSLLMPIRAINKSRGLIIKVNFPKEAILISGILEIAFDTLIKVIIIIAIFFIFNITLSYQILLVPIGILFLFLLGFSIGLILAPIGLLYSDIEKLLATFLPFLMLLTPVIYPEPRTGLASVIDQFNPISVLLVPTRNWILALSTTVGADFILIGCLSIILFIFGTFIFKLSLPIIIERIGS